ncbi:MAG: DUF1585 domain-containing protein [Akkermansiaceae bacterium]|nr:DUF1585 domain-containing protein [Akkermansiaceae bacterium]
MSSLSAEETGTFYNGPGFSGYFELRDLIAERESDFARGLTEHLIGYALGRSFGFTDKDLANKITKSAKAKNSSVNKFIQALVHSEPFHQK